MPTHGPFVAKGVSRIPTVGSFEVLVYPFGSLEISLPGERRHELRSKFVEECVIFVSADHLEFVVEAGHHSSYQGKKIFVEKISTRCDQGKPFRR